MTGKLHNDKDEDGSLEELYAQDQNGMARDIKMDIDPAMGYGTLALPKYVQVDFNVPRTVISQIYIKRTTSRDFYPFANFRTHIYDGPWTADDDQLDETEGR